MNVSGTMPREIEEYDSSGLSSLHFLKGIMWCQNHHMQVKPESVFARQNMASIEESFSASSVKKSGILYQV